MFGRIRWVALFASLVTITACSSTKHVASGTGPQVSSTTTTTLVAPSATSTTIAPPATTTTAAVTATPKTSAALHLSAAVNLPAGQPGKLSVIAVGSAPTDANDSSVPVVVRNNTSGTVYNVSASGTARRSGALVGSGQSQGFAPAAVHPGEWAFGFVYFGQASLVGATFDVTATADAAASSFGQHVDLNIAEVNRTPGQFGEDSLVGIVSNPTATTVSPPIEVFVICFDGANPKSVFSGFTDGNIPLAPKATASFSVSLTSGSCQSYALGSNG